MNMPIEQLFFLLLLVVVPLLDWIIRSIRLRTGSPPEREPLVTGTASPPARPGLPESVAAPKGHPREAPLRRAPRPAAVAAPARDRSARPDLRPKPPVADGRAPIGAPPSRRHVGTPLRAPVAKEDLRRAIGLMTILAPCRAIEPKGG
jgi:hypothetical protein